MNRCIHIGGWMPNSEISKSYKNGYVWKCFTCGGIRKTTPKELKKYERETMLPGLIYY